jgi:hypothetical protein
VRLFPDTKWGVGKLGGVILLLIGTVVVLYLLFNGGPQPDPSQDAIRGYYESAIGGNAPREVELEGCDHLVYDSARRDFVVPKS